MDRKQQNQSLCRTDTGGHTIHGCHSCEAKLSELIEINTDISRYKLCSPEGYHLSFPKYNTAELHSKNRGYNTLDYNSMMISGITNFHFASVVDFYHSLANIQKQLDEAIKMNVLQTKDIQCYNQYLSFLTNERDQHNCLKYPDGVSSDSKCWTNIRLDEAFNVSVCTYNNIFIC